MQRSLLTLLFALVCALTPALFVHAQPADAAKAEATPSMIDAEEPTDRIVAHIQSMTQIVKDNQNEPDKLLADFSQYITENKSKMNKANKDFEVKLKAMSPDESKKYQEGLQRKLEEPMQDFLTQMLAFQKRHPEQAKALDEKLYKVTNP